MGWFSSIKKFIGIAVAVVATIATAGLAASIGVALIGAEAAAAVVGATTVGEIVGGAVIGSGIGAINSGIQGGDILKGALTGAVSGGVGTTVGGLVGGQLGGTAGTYDAAGNFTASTIKPVVSGSEALGAAATKGASQFAGGTAGALAGGAPLTQALKSGAISGASGALTAGLSQGLGLDKTTGGLLGAGISYGLGKAFQPTGGSSVQSRAPQYAQTSQPSQQYLAPPQTTTLGTSFAQPASGQAVGTPSALGSALFAAPGFSYSAGGPVLGGSDTETKAPRNVWSETDKSLRDVGSTVT
jgi:hypothetical protein